MRRQMYVQTGLSDAKEFAHRTGEKVDAPRLRKRQIMLLSVGVISLSLLFAWGFIHLILILVFPNPPIAH